MAKYKAGEMVVLKHHKKEAIVTGVMVEDFSNHAGYSSLFKLTNIQGLPVEEATLNANYWDFVVEESIPMVKSAEWSLGKIIYEMLSKADL